MCVVFHRKIIRFFARLIGRNKAKEPSLRDAIEELIEEDSCSETQSIAKDEREMLENVLDLKDTRVQEIMIPKVEIVSIQSTTSLDSLTSLFVKSRKSSIVIYQDTTDNVIGIVRFKDLATWTYSNGPNKSFDIMQLVKEVLFVPPTMKTLDLLLSMRATGMKVAIVVDEYGDIDGLVSFYDLVEEITGDIQDAAEIENHKKRIVKASDGSIIVDARSTFEELQRYGGINITHEDSSVETIGGLILSIAGKVPARGEIITSSEQNLEFEVLNADLRRVKKIRIHKKG
jgi:CBS domain containing-hemolysin-like protein